MDAPRYTRAELCLIHIATALAAGGERGDAADLLRDRARIVLARLTDPSSDLLWLCSALRLAVDSPNRGAWWRLQLAVAELSIRRVDGLFDPAWEVSHAA